MFGSFKLIILIVAVTITADRQTTFSNSIARSSNPVNIDIGALTEDWEGEVIFNEQYPEYAVRVKEPKLCDKVQQVRSLILF